MKHSFTLPKEEQSPVFGIHGGGCIGLGLIANIVSRSTIEVPYQIIATSNDAAFNEIINASNQFYLSYVGTEERSCIKNITMITREPESITQLYAQASVLAICLTPGAFKESVKDIVKGMIHRYEETKQPLNILILMNQPDAHRYVTELIEQEMDLLLDGRVKDEIKQLITFIHTVPDRVVRKISKDEIARSTENVPSLFQAERYFQFYVPKTYLKEFEHFSDITFVDDIVKFETIKNKYMNGPHTALAWLGALLGCRTIHQSLQFPGMKYFMTSLMQEIATILTMNFPELKQSMLLSDLQRAFFKRCEDSIEDSVSRVGRNPLSKLDRFGRIVGTILMRKGGGSALPYLEMSIAAGVVYALKNPQEQGCSEIGLLYEASQTYEAILCHQGREHQGLDAIRDQTLIRRVINKINLLSTSPVKLMDLEQKIYHLRKGFFSPQDTSTLKGKAMRLFLNRVGININFDTGQLSYKETFNAPSLACELCIVRHGETYGNAGFSTEKGDIDHEAVRLGNRSLDRRIFQGNVDAPINQLTERGKAQAAAVAQDLWGLGWIPDIIFHSPLTRAKETGEPFVRLLREHHTVCDYVELPSIREMSFGKWENARVCDIPEEEACHQFYKEQNALVREDGENVHRIFMEAEHFCDVMMRAHKVLSQLSEQYPGKKVLLNSHSMFGAACLILMGNGMVVEGQNYLAFDGKRANGQSYTLPHTTPVFLNRLTPIELTSRPSM